MSRSKLYYLRPKTEDSHNLCVHATIMHVENFAINRCTGRIKDLDWDG